MSQPKSLFLADVLHNDPCSKAHHDAAAFELRRLHAENESLRQIVEDFPPVESELREVSDRAHRLEQQRGALLEALRSVYATLDQLSFTDTKTTAARLKARAAIAKAEGEKT